MAISIAIEGSEGGGKTLLTRLVVELLRNTTDHPVIVTREPGGTDLGEQIRHLLKTEAFKDMDPLTSAYLFSAQRSELFNKVEKPFLDNNPNGILIKDRSWLSTVVLQVAEGANPEYMDILQKPFVGIPHKFAIIDIPVLETVVRMETALHSSIGREVDWRDKQTQELLGRYRENYLSFAVRHKDNCLMLDCFDDPWEKAASIKLETVRSLVEQNGHILGSEEKLRLFGNYCEEAKRIIDADSIRPALREYDIEDRRSSVERMRSRLNYPSKMELRQKMHDEWKMLGLEGSASGIERGK